MLPALAQTTPGQVGDTLKPPPDIRTPQAPPPVEAAPKSAPAPAPAGKTVRISAFEFRGNTVFRSEELSVLITEYLGRPVTLLDIYAAADVIADLYTSNGYTLASVNVPPQKISDGTVLLEVSEGRIGAVQLEEPARRDSARVQRYLGTGSGDLYRSDVVENGMLQLNELPGLSARALIKPGVEEGTSDLVIRTTEDRVSGVVFADNHGRDSIGENRVAAAVNFNNPTGTDDQVQLLGLVSSGSLLRYGFAGYNLPIGFKGARLALSYGYADFEVRDVSGLNGDSKNAKIRIEQPLLRSAGERLSVSAGIADTRTSTDLDGAAVAGTSITVLELGALYNRLYANAALTQVSTSLSTNFEEQKRADLNPPAGGDVRGKQMARIEVDAIHIQPLPARFSVVGRINTVWSPDPLSDPSAYSIGGPQSIRGFPPSEVRGDRGYFGQLTLQQRYALGPVRLTPRIFVDSGKVTAVDRLPGQPAEQSLTSVGLGTDLEWNRLSIKLDVSDPQGSRVASDGEDSTRVFGALFVGF